MIAPDSPSAAPTQTAINATGRRMLQTMAVVIGSMERPTSARATSAGASMAGPVARSSTKTSKVAQAASAIRSQRRRASAA